MLCLTCNTNQHSFLSMLHHSTLQRRLNVLLSEFQRARRLWHELNLEALNTANSLVNIRLEERYDKKLSHLRLKLDVVFIVERALL
jgi:hypothetical protein